MYSNIVLAKGNDDNKIHINPLYLNATEKKN